MRLRDVCAIALAMVVSGATPAAAQSAKPPAKPDPAKAAPPPDAAERARLMEQAARLLKEGRRQEAAPLLRTAAERFHSVQALLQLARLQSAEGNAQAAVDSLQKARAIAPNSEDVLSALAQVSLGARNPVAAIHVLRSLTRICPDAPEYQYQLGVALMLAGDMPAAAEALERSEQLDPQNSLTLMALGLALNEQKRHAEAKPYLVRSLEIAPESVDALAALAEAEEGLDEVTLAETHARRALTMNAGHGRGNLVMGLLLMRAGRYADARDALLRAVESDASSSRAHYQLSLAYARLGDEANAQKHVQLYQQHRRDAEERLRTLRSGARGRGSAR